MKRHDGSPERGAAMPRIDQAIPARQSWSGIVRRGETLRLVDRHGQQAIDTLFYNADDYGERYSAQDNLRVQGFAYVTVGTRLLPNEGRVMLCVTADDCGRHDGGDGSRDGRALRHFRLPAGQQSLQRVSAGAGAGADFFCWSALNDLSCNDGGSIAGHARPAETAWNGRRVWPKSN